jgi:hypothetical protein
MLNEHNYMRMPKKEYSPRKYTNIPLLDSISKKLMLKKVFFKYKKKSGYLIGFLKPLMY